MGLGLSHHIWWKIEHVWNHQPDILYIYYNSQITTEKIGMVPSIFTLPFPRYISGWWLSPTSLKNMRKSVGMMTFPIYGKITCSKLPTRHIVPLISHVKPSSTQHSPRIKVRDSPQLFGASCSHISAVPAVPAPVQEGSKMEWPHCHPAPNLEPRAEIRGRTNWSFRENNQKKQIKWHVEFVEFLEVERLCADLGLCLTHA
jgi:hypothetical protein